MNKEGHQLMDYLDSLVAAYQRRYKRLPNEFRLRTVLEPRIMEAFMLQQEDRRHYGPFRQHGAVDNITYRNIRIKYDADAKMDSCNKKGRTIVNFDRLIMPRLDINTHFEGNLRQMFNAMAVPKAILPPKPYIVTMS